MEWQLSQHAETVIQERGIALAWIQQTLDCPGRVEQMPDGTWHYLAAITECGGRVLRVVVNPAAAPPRIVTVFFDRRMRGQVP